MPRERLPMRKIRDVLRLHAANMAKRQIATAIEWIDSHRFGGTENVLPHFRHVQHSTIGLPVTSC